MATTLALQVPSPIAALRQARAEQSSSGDGPIARRSPAPPAPPAPPIPATVARADQQAQAWSATMQLLTTSVTTVATAKLAATKNPAYLVIIDAATAVEVQTQATVVAIEAAGAAILAAG
ncbi:MAG TPA: hypothetical protein VM869_35285 [Enhygromyxa sp.]|nr:hypothetical protein [Enhygromyxa sp.]